MKKIDFEEIMKYNLGKGEPIVKIGATGSGKTTLDEVLACQNSTQELLQIREAEGKGSLITTEIVITDDENVPDDGVIIYGEIRRKKIADITDDNDLFGNIMYEAAKELMRGTEDKYKSKIKETLDYYLTHPSNDSLAYQIKDIDDKTKQRLQNLLFEFDKSIIQKIYNEMLAKNPKKRQNGKQIFINLMSTEIKNQEIIRKLWDLIVEIINSDIEKFKTYIINKQDNAYIDDNDNNIKFMVYVTTNESDEKIRNFILKSEYGSKEYLFDKLTIIFRGRKELFDNEFKNLITVAEVDGKEIHIIRFIDTQGILHPIGATVDSEVERIIDILSLYHCRHIILVCNSCISNTQKDSDSVIEKLMQNCKIELNIHVLYTHLDQKLSTENIHNAGANKFSRRNDKIDWSSTYEKVVKEQNDKIENFKTFLNNNKGKRKPIFKSINRAGLYTNIEKLDDLLEQNGNSYNCAIDEVLKSIYFEIQRDEHKIKVSYTDDSIFKELFNSNEFINVESLFNNLIECKGKKLYASTVRACINHWIKYGSTHNSTVKPNPYNYQNINTEFVYEIRNITRNIIKDININILEDIVCDNADKNRFIKLVNCAFKENLGRYIACTIGSDAYNKGFCYDENYHYQYTRFERMLNFVQTYYFAAGKIQIKDKLISAINIAIDKCILEIINTKCIVVY